MSNYQRATRAMAPTIRALLTILWSSFIPMLAVAEKPVVKIGVIVPLSGDMAMHGIEIQNAMQLALRELESNDLYYRYVLYFEDNQLQATKSVSTAQKLIHVEKSDVIVTLWPPTATVVLPLTERSQILHYTISWDPSLARDHKFILSHQAMVDQIARSTLQLLRDQGKTNVAFLHMEEFGFNLGATFIGALATGEGVRLVANEAFQPHETDFRSLIQRVASQGPEGYLIWAVQPSMDILIKQIRNLYPDAFITGYLDYAESLTPIEGTPYVSEMYASDSFVSKYRAAFGKEPVSKGANAFDIIQLLVHAFESSPGRKLPAAELKAILTKVRDFPGAVGTFSVDQNGNSAYLPVARVIKQGKRLLLDR